MTGNIAGLNMQFEAAVRRVSPVGARLFGASGPLLAARMNAARGIGGMFGDHLQHAKFVYSCVMLRSHRCLVEMMLWSYRSWLARGEDMERLRTELEGWREVVRQEIRGVEAPPVRDLYELLLDSHESFRGLAERPLPDPLADGELPAQARDFLCALLLGDETKAVAPVVNGDAVRLLPKWWEGVVAPALHTVGKLWSEGCVSVAEEHVATAIAQQVLQSAIPAWRSAEASETVAVVVPEGEFHTVGAEMVRDYLRIKGYKVFYTGANTPSDGLLASLEVNEVSYLLLSSTMTAGLPYVMDLVHEVRERMGERRPRIVVGGQAYRLDAELGAKVGADVCLQRMEDLGAYLRDSKATPAGMTII